MTTLDKRHGVDVENCLLVTICERPTEFDRFLVLADWYEESGDALASECWRWLAENERCPNTLSVPGRVVKWYWACMALASPRFFCIRLPEHLIKKMTKRTGQATISFLSVREAFLAAVEGWKQLSDAERKECWTWKP